MFATDHTEPRQTSKLEMAHVLFMDIVGYSKLPMDHQEAVLHTLQSVVSATSEFLRAQSSNEIIRLPTGDGMALVFFGDAEAAARCALEVSRALRSHPEIRLRMGLHSGPVYRVTDINTNQNVAGGGINIAQRVMDCSDAGHILASQSVADVLGQLSSWKGCLHDLGEAEVKHGVRVHLYNLYSNEAGNSALPKKVSAPKPAAGVGLKLAQKPTRLRGKMVTAATILVVGLAVGGWFTRKAHALTDKDTIVLADFTNTTGDAVFDGTLRQGLAVQLEQSPFLRGVSDERVQQTLRLMGQPADVKLTPKIARELCLRTGSAAVLDGSIAQIGTQYSLILKAINCSTGESLTSAETEARDKSHVLDALGKAASEIRDKLGESRSTVQKFDTPLEQATTPSLEALQAYSLANKALDSQNDEASAIPLFQRAIELDPNFAMAYARLGVVYSEIGEDGLEFENLRKAFELRDGVSDREKFFIESEYHYAATGDLEKAQESYEVWAKIYPRESGPRDRLGIIYETLGQYDKSFAEMREALRLSPESSLAYDNLVEANLWLNRFDEARATAEEAKAKNLDSPHLHASLYLVAFAQNDAVGMAKQLAWWENKPSVSWVPATEADTAAYSGHLRKAREYSRRAIAAVEHERYNATAASYQATAALREAVFGNKAEARLRATSVLGTPAGRDQQVRYGVALAMALTGDIIQTQSIADDLSQRYPEDTLVRFSFLPTLVAQLALNRNDAAKAIEVLQPATPYELGDVGIGDFYAIFVRGEAYLALHRGTEAAAEFQKILDHRGVVLTGPIGALAHLQIGRAYAMQGDSAKAKAAYQDFLTLWKDADPDIPILKEAKAEYAKLQ